MARVKHFIAPIQSIMRLLLGLFWLLAAFPSLAQTNSADTTLVATPIIVIDSLPFPKPIPIMGKDLQTLPKDTLSYRIKAGDRLRIRNLNSLSILIPQLSDLAVAGAPTTAQGNNNSVFETFVNRTGQITLPKVGRIKVAGLTRAEAIAEIEHGFLTELTVPIFDLEIINLRIKVLGAVVTQGVILLENEKLTLGEVIALSGGIDFVNADKTIKLVRSKGGVQQEINYDIRDLGNPAITNVLIFDGDYVFIPPSKASLRNVKNQRISGILQPIALTLNAIAVLIGLYLSTRPK